MPPYAVALVEDDDDQAALVMAILSESGHSTTHYADGKSILRDRNVGSFDVFLLDWELPDSDGITLLRWLRDTRNVDAPILFTTARADGGDIVDALGCGADDYLVKPMDPAVLVARIEAACRRAYGDTTEKRELRVGNVHLDRALEQAKIDDTVVPLTRREFGLLWILISELGQIVSRDRLLQEVWGMGSDVMTRTVDTHISRLRRKVGLVPERGWKLASVYQQGYRLDRAEQEQSS